MAPLTNPVHGEPVSTALLLKPIVVLLVDLELARLSVRVSPDCRFELPRYALLRSIVPARIPPLAVLVASGPDDDPPMSVGIDAPHTHLIESEQNIRDACDELDPTAIQRFNTDVIGLRYRTGIKVSGNKNYKLFFTTQRARSRQTKEY